MNSNSGNYSEYKMSYDKGNNKQKGKNNQGYPETIMKNQFSGK